MTEFPHLSKYRRSLPPKQHSGNENYSAACKMELLDSLQGTAEDILDRNKRLEFDVCQKAAEVYSASHDKPIILDNWLRTQEDALERARDDQIVMVPCHGADSTARIHIIGEDLQVLKRLVTAWAVPGQIMEHLLDDYKIT
jgi:hypothetical protein